MLVLPIARSEGAPPAWVVEEGAPRVCIRDDFLARAKERCGEVKACHGDAAWRTAVNYVDPCAQLPTQRRVASRAYFKWVELSSLVDVRPGQRVLHLCEAPGGFAQASHDLKLHWTAHSLHTPTSIRFRRLPPDGLLVRHVPAGGDLLDDAALAHLTSTLRGYDHVTADGSLDFEQDHANAEACNFALALREAVVARRALAPGGSFTLKLFDVTLECTWGLVQMLAHWFDRVSLCKPQSSRASNGEVYAVCTGFRDTGEADVATPTGPVASFGAPTSDAALCAALADARFRRSQLAALTAACDVCSGKRLVACTDASAEWWATYGRRVA